MSTKYKDSKSVPSSLIADRLDEISDAIAGGHDSLLRETTMMVPAECDRDADLVLAEAAKRLRDSRLSSDPLTALYAVMREHNITIDSNSCDAIRDGSDGTHHLFIWCGDDILSHKFTKIKNVVRISHDDIKPEPDNENLYS